MTAEIDAKTARLSALAREHGLAGVLVATPPNFAWLSGGRSNRIDLTRDPGAGTLFVGADGRRVVFANAIEMPRLEDEALTGLAFSPVACPWPEERATPSWMVDRARDLVAGTGTPIGADWPVAGATLIDAAVAAARAPLVPEEIERYRRLGRDAGLAVGDACRSFRPGQTEQEIAGALMGAVAGIGARPLVTLVGADDRIDRYRHPFPTDLRWRRVVLIAVCAERHGLIVSLSRFVTAGPPPESFTTRLAKTAAVFAALLEATTDGATGAEIFRDAVDAYARAGAPGEELRHHQGGAIGYRTREWVAHPASRDRVRLPHAFSWNPTITGTKIEDTALVTDAGVELLTATPDWPAIEITVRGQTLRAARELQVSTRAPTT